MGAEIVDISEVRNFRDFLTRCSETVLIWIYRNETQAGRETFARFAFKELEARGLSHVV